MATQWEIFDDGPTKPFQERVHVTLNRKNVIHLNATMFERLGRPEAAILLFDRVNSVIGINPAPKTLPNAFPLKQKANGRHRIIHASPFCRRFGIRIDQTELFTNPEIDHEGVLRLDLRSTVPVYKRRVLRSRK